MSTKRRIIDRGKGGRLTPDIIAAWNACDFSALHLLLRLRPWDSTPLPKEIAGGLGVSQDDLLDFDPDTASPADQSLPKIVAIQAELLAVAGWPDGARAAYEKNWPTPLSGKIIVVSKSSIPILAKSVRVVIPSVGGRN